jgi:hypothetical protein
MTAPKIASALTGRRRFLQILCAGGIVPVAMQVPREARVAVTDALDHLVLGVADLEAGIRWVEERTGVRAVAGGSHPGVGTRNALLSLGGRQYLEIFAPDPAQAQIVPQYASLRTLESPRLMMWAAAARVEETAARFRAAGLDASGPSPGSRARPDGKLLSWRTVVVKHDLGFVIPFFIEWDATAPHPAVDSPAGCRLLAFELAHPRSEAVTAMLASLGIDAVIRNGPTASLSARLQSPKGTVELV